MKARTAIALTAHRVRLTVGWGLMTVLACVALSACSTPSTSSPPAVFSPAVTGSPSASPSPSSSASPSPSASASPSPDSASPVPTITYTYTYYPSGAPITGGGGTAGFQDAGLAVLGGVAIVAGLGTIAYRHRMTRNR